MKNYDDTSIAKCLLLNVENGIRQRFAALDGFRDPICLRRIHCTTESLVLLGERGTSSISLKNNKNKDRGVYCHK